MIPFRLGTTVVTPDDKGINAFADVELLPDGPATEDLRHVGVVGVRGDFQVEPMPAPLGRVRVRLWGRRGLASFKATPRTVLSVGVPGEASRGHSRIEVNFILPSA